MSIIGDKIHRIRDLLCQQLQQLTPHFNKQRDMRVSEVMNTDTLYARFLCMIKS